MYFSKGKVLIIEGEFERFGYKYGKNYYTFSFEEITSIQIPGCFTRGMFVPDLFLKYVKINTSNGNQIIVTSLMMPQLESVFFGETILITSYFPYLSKKMIVIRN